MPAVVFAYAPPPLFFSMGHGILSLLSLLLSLHSSVSGSLCLCLHGVLPLSLSFSLSHTCSMCPSILGPGLAVPGPCNVDEGRADLPPRGEHEPAAAALELEAISLFQLALFCYLY